MNVECLPIIRLEVEHLKHAISHYMGIEGSDLEQAIRQAIDKKAIEKKVQEQIQYELSNVISSAIRDYFLHGEGNDLVVDSIRSALKHKKEQKADA